MLYLGFYRGKERWSQILTDTMKMEQSLEKIKEQKAKVLKEKDESLKSLKNE